MIHCQLHKWQFGTDCAFDAIDWSLDGYFKIVCADKEITAILQQIVAEILAGLVR